MRSILVIGCMFSILKLGFSQTNNQEQDKIAAQARLDSTIAAEKIKPTLVGQLALLATGNHDRVEVDGMLIEKNTYKAYKFVADADYLIDSDYKNVSSNDYKVAISLYDSALYYGFKDALLYYNKGFCWYKLELYAKAIADFTKSIDLLNGNLAFFKREECLMLVNEVYQYQEEMIPLTATPARIFGIRGDCKRKLKDNQSAIYDLTKAIELQPNEPLYHFIRGISFLQSGNRSQACTNFSRAGELGHEEAYNYIAEYCQ